MVINDETARQLFCGFAGLDWRAVGAVGAVGSRSPSTSARAFNSASATASSSESVRSILKRPSLAGREVRRGPFGRAWPARRSHSLRSLGPFGPADHVGNPSADRLDRRAGLGGLLDRRRSRRDARDHGLRPATRRSCAPGRPELAGSAVRAPLRGCHAGRSSCQPRLGIAHRGLRPPGCDEPPLSLHAPGWPRGSARRSSCVGSGRRRPDRRLEGPRRASLAGAARRAAADRAQDG
jgi:hypothetical protein